MNYNEEERRRGESSYGDELPEGTIKVIVPVIKIVIVIVIVIKIVPVNCHQDHHRHQHCPCHQDHHYYQYHHCQDCHRQQHRHFHQHHHCHQDDYADEYDDTFAGDIRAEPLGAGVVEEALGVGETHYQVTCIRYQLSGNLCRFSSRSSSR